MEGLRLLRLFPGLHGAGLCLEDQVLRKKGPRLAGTRPSCMNSTHLILDLHRGKDMNSLLQFLERGLLEWIGSRRPDERTQVVVHRAEDVFSKRGYDATINRVIGRNKDGHFLRIIPEVSDVKIGFLARNHRLELWHVVIEPAKKMCASKYCTLFSYYLHYRCGDSKKIRCNI